MRRTSTLFVVAMLTTGCGAGVAGIETRAPSPPAPAEPAALGCGQSRLSSDAIPTERGAENRADAASKALLAGIDGGNPDLTGKHGWLELTREHDRVHFVWGDAPAYGWDAVVEVGPSGWMITGWGAGCTIRRVVDDRELNDFSVDGFSDAGRTLTLSTLVGACGTPEPKERMDPRVAEYDDRVEISLTMLPADPVPSPPPGVFTSCPAIGQDVTVDVALSRPLGDRAVHDMSWYPRRVAVGPSGPHAGAWPDPTPGSAVNCVSEHPERLADNAHAVDGTITHVVVGPRNEDAAAAPVSVSLDLHEVFAGADRPRETVKTWDFLLPADPQDAVGVRVLVATGPTLDLKACGYTRPYSWGDAELWRETFSSKRGE